MSHSTVVQTLILSGNMFVTSLSVRNVCTQNQKWNSCSICC